MCGICTDYGYFDNGMFILYRRGTSCEIFFKGIHSLLEQVIVLVLFDYFFEVNFTELIPPPSRHFFNFVFHIFGKKIHFILRHLATGLLTDEFIFLKSIYRFK